MPIISYASPSVLLSNKNNYKYFFRVPPYNMYQSEIMKLKKLVLTGAAGRLGSYLREPLSQMTDELVSTDIAEDIGMHESTISRVTTNKYMHTPRGIYELKYFFSSHVATATGGECSSTAIKALIKKLIAAEDTAKPLSDSKLATILSDQGIKVARRTVAKYREALAIPPSNERKSLL